MPAPELATSRIFLLSPARCSGERAKVLFRPQASFELAMQLRTPMGAPIGDVFSFLSGLYFRGKLAYARHFGDRVPQSTAAESLPTRSLHARSKLSRAYVLTTSRGLLPPETHVTIEELRAMADVSIDADEPRYRGPIERDLARIVASRRSKPFEFVLLGSIATRKYVDVLLPALGDRLHFPADFVGRGDMSRGGLMLRCVRENRELAYVPIDGAIRHGTRPPKLDRGTGASPMRNRAGEK